MQKNQENEKNILLISYEDLCDHKEFSVQRIQEFVPEIGDLKSDLEFSAHNFKTKGKMKVQNLNTEKINKLSSEDIKIINSYFKKEESLLKYFGYSIIN